jgi:beta-mannosidase
MQRINLDGIWQLGESGPGAGDAQGWQRSGVPEGVAIRAQVPGDVHLDLLRAGRIAEPLVGKHALDCRWVEARDWWYSRAFVVDASFLEGADRVELHAAGLDLTAEVWLNGEHVGSHNNQFVPAIFDVTQLLHAGDNLLVIRLDVGLQAASADRRRYVHISSLPASGLPRMWMRKAQFSFGWDWAPRLLTCGIWRPIALVAHKQLAIRDVFLSTRLVDGAACIPVRAEIESFAEGESFVTLNLQLGPEACTHGLDVTLQPGPNVVETELVVANPRLWWPRSLGEPFLYDFCLEASEGNLVLDRYETQVGLREVSLLEEPLPGTEGTSFTIQVNGQPVFCQGANWVPADSILARVNRAKYKALIDAAAEANFTMLRVWGGGIYEDPYFYRLCDEAGIMIWQDFMFACSLYPDDDPDFCQEVQSEAETVIKQLRNHPSLVLWCGNNENDWIYWQRTQAGWELPTFYGRRIYHEILPEACNRLDPTRPYWPSSPYGGEDPNSGLVGDQHHWDVPLKMKDPHERVDFCRWSEERGKFISEYGMLAPPAEESLRRFLAEDQLHPDSPEWDFHNNAFEMDNLATSLRLYFGNPQSMSLGEYVVASQIIQAEALKHSLEHLRHRRFATSGALFWMYSDCWGAIGWSIVDYYLNRKPSFYYVRRALAPLLVSFHQEEEDRLDLWLTNATLQSRSCRVEYGVLDLSDSRARVETKDTTASANTSRCVASVALAPGTLKEPGRYLPFARLLVDGRVASCNRWFLTGFKFNDLHLPPALGSVTHTVERVGEGEFRLQLQSEVFAWAVRLELPSSVWVEDNYFDLLPGEQREFALRGSSEDVEQLRVAFTNDMRRSI